MNQFFCYDEFKRLYLVGELSFNKNWTEYKNGFGKPESDSEFWIGEFVNSTTFTVYAYTWKDCSVTSYQLLATDYQLLINSRRLLAKSHYFDILLIKMDY